MYTFYNYKTPDSLNIDMIFCEEKDMSTAYKVIVTRERVQSLFIAALVRELEAIQREYECDIKEVVIVADSITQRAYDYLKMFEEYKFEYSDKNAPDRYLGLDLWFYFRGEIFPVYTEVEHVYSESELKYDIVDFFPEYNPDDFNEDLDYECYAFYTRKGVLFSDIPDYVKDSYQDYCFETKYTGIEPLDYALELALKADGTRGYYKLF